MAPTTDEPAPRRRSTSHVSNESVSATRTVPAAAAAVVLVLFFALFKDRVETAPAK